MPLTANIDVQKQWHDPEDPAFRGKAVADCGRFSDLERRLLLGQPRIGPQVLAQLEAVGIHSLAALRELGVPHAVGLACARVGTSAWANRRRALAQAVDQLTARS